MKILWAVIAAISFSFANASVVDTVAVYSKAMNRSSKCVVIRPFIEGQKPIPLPTVYLLHGWSGHFGDWLKRVPQIREYADTYQVIIVCPDGAYAGWYLDSPLDKAMKYETYISKEVPAFIDSAYLTIKDRRRRAITGLSMGGHGALFIAFRNAQTFGACGSMSGVVDLNSFNKSYDINKLIGDTVKYKTNWKNYSVTGVVEKKPKDSLAIIFDCGVDDFTYADNKKLHEKMVKLKIAHDYIERPGGHTWTYWANAIQYQMMYFRKFFEVPYKK